MSARILSASSQVPPLSQSLCTVLNRSKRIPMENVSISNVNTLTTGYGVYQSSFTFSYGTHFIEVQPGMMNIVMSIKLHQTNNLGETILSKRSKSVPVMLKLLPPDAEICCFHPTSYQRLLQAVFLSTRHDLPTWWLPIVPTSPCSYNHVGRTCLVDGIESFHKLLIALGVSSYVFQHLVCVITCPTSFIVTLYCADQE